MIWVPAQLVSAFHGDNITLTCFVEAHPTSLNYWEKDGVMVHQNLHYRQSQERGTPAYKVRPAQRLETGDCVTGRDEADHHKCRAGSFWQIYLCGQEPAGPDRRKHYIIR